MPAPITELREAVQALLELEFPAVSVRPDRIHESLGDRGVVIGVSPEGETLAGSPEATMRVMVQYYGRYKLDIDPKQQVDPTVVEAAAEQFKTRMQGKTFVNGKVWFFNVLEVTYPEDPTGNKTRFEALIEGHGDNTALIETVGP